MIFVTIQAEIIAKLLQGHAQNSRRNELKAGDGIQKLPDVVTLCLSNNFSMIFLLLWLRRLRS